MGDNSAPPMTPSVEEIAGEQEAVRRLREFCLLAARQMAPDRSGSVALVIARAKPPSGERFKMVASMKSPMGWLANVKLRDDGRYDCVGYFPAIEVLAFCMAKLDELGAECPVYVTSAAALQKQGEPT